LHMSRIHPECPDSDLTDRSVAADVVFAKSLRRKKTKRKTKATVMKMTMKTTKTTTGTRSERPWFQHIIGIQFGAERSANEVSSSVRDWLLVGR